MTLTSRPPSEEEAGAVEIITPDGALPHTRRDGSTPEDVLQRARGLRAFTFELDQTVLPDLVRAGGAPQRWLWRKNDLVLLGAGEALRAPMAPGWADPAHTGLVSEVLAAIPSTGGPDRLARGPVAMGALPYDPARGGHLSIPRLTVGRQEGTAWATLIVPEAAVGTSTGAAHAIDEELRQLREIPVGQPLPDRFDLGADMPHEQWKDLVRRAVAEMADGRLAKVVLARRVDVVANRPFVLHETLSRLESLYPSCAVFHVEGFIGASPETLVRRHGHEIMSHPLAGTVARSGDDKTDAALLAGLLASAKDRREHQLVVDAIVDQLGALCSSLEVPPEPSVLALRNVSHLGTMLRGTLVDSADGNGGHSRLPTALELAAFLQPTPAVGGHPTDAALRWQRDNEGFDRGCYAGPVGWVDACGDGEWALGLRSANVSGCHAALYAGNGIVVGSDADAELAETQLKLQALLAALVRP